MRDYIIIYNNLSKDFNHSYCQRILDITEFYIKPAQQSFNVVVADCLHHCLNQLAEQNCQWAVVNAVGHAVHQPQLYQSIISDCQARDVALMAHIIARPGAYPELDPQFIVINMPIWRQLGRPVFENHMMSTSFTSCAVERSSENHHDDYTPYWIRGSSNQTPHVATGAFGQQAIRQYLEQGYTIENFNSEVRRDKWHLYPNANQAVLEPLLFQGKTFDFMPSTLKQIINERETLPTTVYILNSEPVRHVQPQHGVCQHIMAVAAGFKTVLLLNHLEFDPHTVVTYFDISSAGLQFQQFIIAQWNGDLSTYWNCVQQFHQLYPDVRLAWRSWNSWQDEINDFLQQAGVTETQFQSLWQRYQRLTHYFLNLDLLQPAHQDRLIQHCVTVNKQNVYVWVSNLFDMQYTRVFLGKQHTDSLADRFRQQLSLLNQSVQLEAQGVTYCL
jgi:hypothetical protein